MTIFSRMALYYELPVYRVSYDLIVEIFAFTKQFGKEYKYTIGERLKNEAIELVIGIYQANMRRDKDTAILSARERVETIRLLVRILKDVQQIGIERLISVNEKIESLSKQLVAWQRSVSPKASGGGV